MTALSDPSPSGLPPKSDKLRMRRRRVRLRGTSRRVKDKRQGRILAAIMAPVVLLYGAISYHTISEAASVSNGLKIGALQRDITYQLGTPTGSSGPDWLYASRGQRLALHFDAAQRLDRITCTSAIDADKPCDPVLGVGIGAEEGALTMRLGQPTRTMMAGADKLAFYDGLGVMMRLREEAVVAITHQAPTSSGAFWRQVWWEMLP